MSKRNRHNRFSDHSDIQETASESKPPLPVIVENGPLEDTDDTEKVSLFSKIGTFCGGCREKTVTCSRSAVSATWKVLRQIPRYCVLRWDSDKEEEGNSSSSEPSGALPNREAKAMVPVQPTDDDELPPSRWWNLSIKTAAAAAAVAILAGGYFAVKPLLFNTSTEIAGIETVEQEAEEQGGEEALPSVAVALVPEPRAPESAPQPAWEVPSVAAPSVPADPPVFTQALPPEPVTVQVPVAAQVPAPTQAEQPLPPQDAVFDNPFTAPAVAEAAPPVADIFDAVQAAAVPPSAPALELDTLADELTQPLTKLQPLAPLEPAQSPLQPLVALNASAFPSSTFDAAASAPAIPAPAVASARAPVASNRNPQRNQHSPAFSAPPTPPTVHTLPQTPVQPTIALVEPIQEVIPQIPPSGTIQNVPPPIPMPVPVAAEIPSRPMHPNESAPAIPQDAPMTAAPMMAAALPAAVVSAPVPAASENMPRIVPLDSQPLDWELWEQVRLIQNVPDAAPSQLRFENQTAASEPVLRFTSGQAAAPVNAASAYEEGDTYLNDALSQFSALMPSSESGTNVAVLESFLPLLEDAPPPVYAEPSPAYRDGQVADRGMTFQSRIDSEISRSPSAPETYVVQEGDTYMTISDRFYGTSLLYTALAQHNQKLGIGWRPSVGVVIEVPPAEFLRMHYGTSPHQQERRLDAQRQGMRYIVQEGDTVFRLATDRLRDSTRWREIYAINADRLSDVRELQPGMEILLPL